MRIAGATEIPYPYNKEHALSWIDQTLTAGRKRVKTEAHFALDKDGEVIGGIGLRKIDGYQGEIGYWVGERYWGQGIISAVEAVARYAFTDLRLERVYACLFPSNRALARLLEKAGQKFEGTTKMPRRQRQQAERLSGQLSPVRISSPATGLIFPILVLLSSCVNHWPYVEGTLRSSEWHVDLPGLAR